VNPFFPAAQSSLWFAFILSNTISKALQQLNRPIHLNKLFPGRVFSLKKRKTPQNSLPFWRSQKRHKSLPVINLACLCLKKDKWDVHC